MGMDVWIGWMGLAGTLLLVAVGLLNFTVFRKQLQISQDQIDTALRQLEIAQKQPDLHLIQRAIAETSDHLRLIVERPYLRRYFYDGVRWEPGGAATEDEVKAVAELMLNSFASALMHSAAFPEYPVRGIDRNIAFHLRNSPALRGMLLSTFDRFPFTGLSMLCLMHAASEGVEADLLRLAEADGVDAPELERRRELLRMFRAAEVRDPIAFTALSMQKRR